MTQDHSILSIQTITPLDPLDPLDPLAPQHCRSVILQDILSKITDRTIKATISFRHITMKKYAITTSFLNTIF